MSQIRVANSVLRSFEADARLSLCTATPDATVIIPAHNSEGLLRSCLECLRLSQGCRFEVIVVDDASTDATADVAEQLGAQVIRLDQNLGPAAARNHGAELAQGEILVFIDSDVFVTPSTIASLVNALQESPQYDAVIGSYDANPTAQNLISQYKNLLHHFTHQRANPEATTFWTGCGAVRAKHFDDLGGFDERFGRPCIEDIEFGSRLRDAGGRIRLMSEIQVKHSKRWQLASLVRTDFFDRALPWTRLILENNSMPNDLNLKLSQRLCVACVALLSAWIVLALWWEPFVLLLVTTSLALILLVDRIEDTAWHRTGTRLAATLLAGCFLVIAYWAPISCLAITATLAVVTIVNSDLLRFFAKTRGWIFAVVAMPIHVLYYFYSGVGFVVGCVQHFYRTKMPHQGA